MRARHAYIDGPRGDLATVPVRDTVVAGEIVEFDTAAGRALVQIPVGGADNPVWCQLQPGVYAPGAIVRVQLATGGRPLAALAPDTLPAGVDIVGVGETGRAVVGATEQATVALDASRQIDARTVEVAEMVSEASDRLDDARIYIDDVVTPGLEAAQDTADTAAADATQAKADALAAHTAAMGAATTAEQAQTAAANAQAQADSATDAAADAAAAAATADGNALAAMGVANGKGKVIRQEAEPTGTDATANNLWIKTSTGQPYAHVDGTWTLVTDSRITAAANSATSAATAAANAQTAATNAATAASAAQSTADTAVSNAAAANSAALAASSAASAAQSKADSAFANATTAQGAADNAANAAADAAGIAGGKADVLIQSSAPAMSMRKATTLWIDTTGNANTPKRWSGSAWVAVTDKAATDAAAAAATAQTAANNAAAEAADAKTLANNAAASALGAQSAADAAQGTATTADRRYKVATANPTASDATGRPIGAVWEVRSGGTTLRRYVLTDATTWTQVKAGQDFIGANAIGTAQIADAAVGTAQIADLAVTNGKIGDLSVDKLRVTGGAEFPTAVVNTLVGQDAFVDRLVAEKVVVAGNSTNKVDAIMLEDGAVTAGKINATAEMWAKILAVAGDATIGGHLIVDGGVAARHLNVVSDAVNGKRLSIQPDGIRMWAENSEAETPLVSLTTASDDFFSVSNTAGEVLASVNADGSLSGTEVSADVMYLDGEHLGQVVKAMPRGAILYAQQSVRNRSVDVSSAAEAFMGLMEFSLSMEAGRTYSFSMTPLSVYLPALTYAMLEMRYTTDGSKPTFVSTRRAGFATNRPVGARDMVSLSGETQWTPSSDTDLRVLICIRSWTTSATTAPVTVYDSGVSGVALLYVYDEGIREFQSNMAIDRANIQHSSGSATNPTTGTGLVTKTKTYESTTGTTYYGNTGGNNRVGLSSMWRKVVGQGSFGSGTQGNLTGLWIFPSMLGDLNGATIKKAELYIKNVHTAAGSGATAYIYSHGHNQTVPETRTALTADGVTKKFAKSAGMWITLPESHHARILSGAIDGYGLSVAGSTNYGYWAETAKLRITYEK